MNSPTMNCDCATCRELRIEPRTGLTATAEKNVMSAENQVHKLFLRYVETIGDSTQRNDFFDPRNRDAWLIGFGEWLAEQQREYIKTYGASND